MLTTVPITMPVSIPMIIRMTLPMTMPLTMPMFIPMAAVFESSADTNEFFDDLAAPASDADPACTTSQFRFAADSIEMQCSRAFRHDDLPQDPRATSRPPTESTADTKPADTTASTDVFEGSAATKTPTSSGIAFDEGNITDELTDQEFNDLIALALSMGGTDATINELRLMRTL